MHLGPLKWESLPLHTQKEMTNFGELMFRVEWLDESSTVGGRIWHRDEFDYYYNAVKSGKCKGSYAEACDFILEAFAKFPITNKTVLVVGSQSPWIEALAIFSGAGEVHTCDFQIPIDDVHLPNFRILKFSEIAHQYDVVISYSSLEHDGLGRYGDPIHPNGDILRVEKIRTLIKPNGYLFLGISVGPDALCFNVHRIYGKKRLAQLTKGFKMLGHFTQKKFPMSLEEYIEKVAVDFSWENQPVIVLKKTE